MRRFGVFLFLIALLTAACTTVNESTGFGCMSAPEDQRHSTSAFPLSVSDNPVHPGATITLNIGSTVTQTLAQSTDLYGSDRGVTGYGSTWQCWNGSEWVNTHLLVHDGETLTGKPGSTTTVPAIGIPVPGSFSIVVPDVDPGWYRIAANIWVDQPEGSPAAFSGHIGVEAVQPD
ncbi:MAG: hypothetical protein M3132_06235 [Actinomycetia bacterium]|nr:hypothetical protein [Actinomycetes bacterium]